MRSADRGGRLDAADGETSARSVWRRRLSSIEVAAGAGIVCGVGWSVSLRGLLDRPDLHADRAEVVRFFADGAKQDQVPLLLAGIVVGTVAFLWFVGVIRGRLGRWETRLVGTVFLGGSIVLTGLVLVGASVLAAPSILVSVGGQTPDPGAAMLLRALAAVVLSVFAPRIATLIMFSAAALCRQSGALPMWLIVVTYVVAIVEFVNVTLAAPTLYLFPAWIVLVSVTLLARRSGPAHV